MLDVLRRWDMAGIGIGIGRHVTSGSRHGQSRFRNYSDKSIIWTILMLDLTF